MKRLENYKAIVLPIILKHLPDAKVYLFGSRARHDDKEGSDIDIALDTGSKINLNSILTIKDEIEDSDLPVFIDVVDMNAVSQDFKEEIIKDGIVWVN